MYVYIYIYIIVYVHTYIYIYVYRKEAGVAAGSFERAFPSYKNSAI